MPKPPIQLRSGDIFYTAPGEIYRDECCQCGLAHLVQITLTTEGLVAVQTWTDPKYKPARHKAK